MRTVQFASLVPFALWGDPKNVAIIESFKCFSQSGCIALTAPNGY
jgi:hypothetical protein